MGKRFHETELQGLTFRKRHLDRQKYKHLPALYSKMTLGEVGACHSHENAMPVSCQFQVAELALVKFIYFEKATKFCKISTVDLSCIVMVKSTMEKRRCKINYWELTKYPQIKSRYSFSNCSSYSDYTP